MTMHADSKIATMKIVKREEKNSIERKKHHTSCRNFAKPKGMHLHTSFEPLKHCDHIPATHTDMRMLEYESKASECKKKLNVKCETINIKNAMRLA